MIVDICSELTSGGTQPHGSEAPSSTDMFDGPQHDSAWLAPDGVPIVSEQIADRFLSVAAPFPLAMVAYVCLTAFLISCLLFEFISSSLV
jgi:hypothetical protein